jgi:hypothetical protein
VTILGAAGYELPNAASSTDASLRLRVRLLDGTLAEVVYIKLRSKKTPVDALVLDAGQRGEYRRRGKAAMNTPQTHV